MYLAPLDCAALSCDGRYSVNDAHGIKHVLLCDFAPGSAEVVPRGSTQAWPTVGSNHNTGVDHLVKPSRYIVWSNDMNKRILPKYVISFSMDDF